MKFVFLIICLLNFVCYFAQPVDTVKLHLKAITITAFKEEAQNQTSLNISNLEIDSLSRFGNFNLTDMLSKTSGVTMLSTGVAISKPVIRGLYGNRVLVLLSGLRFDNQQWQEEHGLGLSDLGLSKVELIKGPMSVLYGTEAIGGVINLIEEQKPNFKTKESDYAMKFNSNTLGGTIQAGYKVNTGKNWFRFRFGVENNADYSDGNNKRVLNSRFDGYYLKSSFGFVKKNWISTTNYFTSFNRFGFIFNDIYNFVFPDNRYSRSLNINPTHLVLLNIISCENKFTLKNQSKLSLNAGIQSNERMENEGGGAISLNMHLLTFQYLLKWEKELNEKHKLIVSNLASFEVNTNYGSRKIVPDANMQESNLSIYYETNLKEKWIFENGVSVGEKWIKTKLTPSVNTVEKDIDPFSKFSPFYNVFSGFSFVPNNKVNVKFNVASGVRVPNLAELSSNGLHEGVFTYEIGSPDLKNEQNLTFNMLFNFTSKHVDFSISPFYNYFLNYVYLTPTAEEWFGFPVFRYKQQDAQQYGGEANVNFKFLHYFQLNTSYSGMISQTKDGMYTPFIPAQKISPNLQYTRLLKNNRNINLFVSGDYCFAQNKIYLGEIKTPSYFLLNAGISSKMVKNTKTFELSLIGNNLLNEAYYDHLSRFKYFGLLNIGRNVMLNLKVKFNSQLDK